MPSERRAVPTDRTTVRSSAADRPARRRARTAATTRSSTSGSWSRPAGRGGRGSAPRSPRSPTTDRPTSPTATCARATCAPTATCNPDYADDVRLRQRLRGAPARTRPRRPSSDGLLRAEGERGVVPGGLLLAPSRPDPRRHAAGRRSAGSSTSGPTRPSELGRGLPLGPGVREPRRGDGRLEPAPARPDLGRHGAARRGAPRGREPGAPPGRDRTPPAARLRRPGVGRPAGRRRERRVAGRRAVLGGLAVRDAASSRSGRPRACPTWTTPRATSWRPSLVELLGRYDGLFRRPFPYSMGWHQAPFGDEADRRLAGPRPLLSAAAARPTSASSWSATSCSPRRSATSPPRTPPNGCARSSLRARRPKDRRLPRPGRP